MKVAVVGSRNLWVEDLGKFLPEGTTEIVSGGAKGIDTRAREYALANNLPLTEFLPEYKKYGRGAPLKRNISIIEYADFVVAFWDGASRGTRFVMDECLKRGKPIEVFALMEKTSEEKAWRIFREDLAKYGQGSSYRATSEDPLSERIKSAVYPRFFHLCKWEQKDNDYVEFEPKSWDKLDDILKFLFQRKDYDDEEEIPEE